MGRKNTQHRTEARATRNPILTSIYTLGNQEDVYTFLADRPALTTLLLDLAPCLEQVFPGARFSLHLLRPQQDEATSHVLMLVTTALPLAEGLDRLNGLATGWLATADPQRALPLLLDISSTLDIEPSAPPAERYRQRFSTSYQGHLELARRVLDAAPGSDEQILAQAELSAALAPDHERPTTPAGGDPRLVLARLRRQRLAQTPSPDMP